MGSGAFSRKNKKETKQMKKLMIAAAIVCAAAASQAASVTWQSGTFTTLPSCMVEDEFPGEGYTGAGDWTDGCIKALVWESTTDWGFTSAKDVWDAYTSGDKTLDPAKALTGVYDPEMLALDVAGSNIGVEGTRAYAAILYLHDDNLTFENPDFYMANVATALASDMGASVLDLGNSWGGTGGAATVWSEAVATPEPTSGLLLLLGVAGLALRRRCA